MANLFIIAAPSGCGKTSLVEALIKKTENLCVSVSHTTRPPRSDEINGINYYFISNNDFDGMVNNGAFVEHAMVFDNHYGSSTKLIKDKLNEGVNVILEIDWQGARQVKENMPNAISIFILPPSKEALLGRLQQRAQDNDAIIIKRMSDAQNPMQHFNEFDYLVINDDFNSALNDLNLIICRADKDSERFSLSLSEQSKKYRKLLKKLI